MPDFEEPVSTEPTPAPAYTGLSLVDLLQRAQRALYATLLQRIEDGTADKDDIKTLRQLLAENGMVLKADDINRRMIDVTPQPLPIPDFSGEDFDQ